MKVRLKTQIRGGNISGEAKEVIDVPEAVANALIGVGAAEFLEAEEAPVETADALPPAQVATRRRGRPKGSKNKPKPKPVVEAGASEE